MTDVGFRTALLPQAPYMPSIEGNVSSPRYRDGSVNVEFEIDKLLHGIPENTQEPANLSVAEDSEFTISWQIHAESFKSQPKVSCSTDSYRPALKDLPFGTLAELLKEIEPAPRKEH